MATSLSELVVNMAGNFNSIKRKSFTENNRSEECKKIRINQKVSKYISVLQW